MYEHMLNSLVRTTENKMVKVKVTLQQAKKSQKEKFLF